MKIKLVLHLLIGILVLLVSSIVGCSPGYTQEDLNTAYQEGYSAGFAAGLAECEELPSPAPAPAPTPTPEPEPEPETEDHIPSGAISWEDAIDHIGDRLTVCGPVVDTYWASGSSGKPTFLNIGESYPDPDRFTVVIWIDNRGNFPSSPEDYYLGKTICVTGLIQSYEGTPQIEATDSSQIEGQ